MALPGQPQGPSIALMYPDPPSPVIQYGAQPPQLAGFANLLLMTDRNASNRGPAYIFQQRFNKTVIVKEGDIPGSIPNSKRDLGVSFKRWFGTTPELEGAESFTKRQQSDWTQKEFAHKGDRPWYCFWNETVLEGFIYITQDLHINDGATATSTALPVAYTGGSTKRQAPPNMPQFPKLMKIDERRKYHNFVRAYCQQFQILDNLQLGPVNHPDGTPNIISISESEFATQSRSQGQTQPLNQATSGGVGQPQAPQNRRRAPQSACECAWGNR